MTHKLYLMIIIYWLNVTTINHAMYGKYLTNNEVVFSRPYCFIVDLTTGTVKDMKEICSWIKPHNNGVFIGKKNDTSITAKSYDITTKELQWETKIDGNNRIFAASSYLNPFNENTVCLWNTGTTFITEYNHTTKRTQDISFTEGNDGCDGYVRLYFCPKKEHVILSRGSLEKRTIYTYKNNELAFLKENIIKRDSNWEGAYHYSPDGSILASHDLKNNMLRLEDTTEYNTFYSTNIPNNIWCICFHPNNAMIAFLIYGDSVQFFDITTKQIINLIPLSDIEKNHYKKFSAKNFFLSEEEYKHYYCNGGNYCEFSPDGNTFLIRIKNFHYIIPTPDEIIYEKKNKAIFAHWFLKNYKPDSCDLLPHDIIPFITHTLLETYKQRNQAQSI